MKHGLIHVLGCLVPLALIFILPMAGVSSGVTYTLFIVLMFACHLFMMGEHGNHDAGANERHAGEGSEGRKGGGECH